MKNNLKKTLSIICMIMMVLGLFAGCSTTKSAGGQKKSSQKAATNQSEEIGEDAALEIALEDAGLKESDVTVTKLKLDYDDDDGTNEYEIEFRDGTYEYDYTIDPYTGRILERDKDIDD